METNRRDHALVSYDGRLYAFGGYNGNHLNSMESFDPRMRKWEKLTSMKENRDGLCGVVCNGEIYAIGGYELDSVERYNFRTNSWMKPKRMNYERHYASACVVNGKIYVVGGGNESRTSVEVYDPTIDEWKIETNMEIPRRASSVVAL
uniref:Uncharacterized protein n=1 Tax=Ciona savignyi TaxID=51511 RepID=H2YGS7_CIOSA